VLLSYRNLQLIVISTYIRVPQRHKHEMPMHPRTATEKGGKRYRWDKTGADAVNFFFSLYLDDYDGKTKSENWQISPFHNYNKQGFFKTLISTQKCIDLFPCGFSEEGF
jgi:hypothetical protein